MQGQKGVVGSLSEALNFEHGSTSANSNIDQICWTNMQSPATTSNAAIDRQISWNAATSYAENQISNYVVLPNHLGTSYDTMNHQWSNWGGWNADVPSSSNSQGDVNYTELKAGLGWTPSASSSAGPQLRLDERLYESRNALSLDGISRSSIFTQSSGSGGVPQNLNLNAGFMINDGVNDQRLEHPHSHKANGLINECNPPDAGSGSYVLPSGGNGFLVEDNDGSSGYSLESRRVSCKRKAIEGLVGQSSVSGSSGHSQNTDNGVGQGVPAEVSSGRNLSISASQEHVNARLGLSLRDEAPDCLPEPSGGGISDGSHRNFRLRINPSNQQESLSPVVLSSGSARHSGGSSSRMALRFLPVNQPPEMRSAEAVDNVVSQGEPIVFQVPPLPRNSRLNGSSGARIGQPPRSVVSGGRDTLQHVDVSSRSTRRILQHPMFVPATDFQNLVRNPAVRTPNGTNISIPGNFASPSQTGSSLASHLSSSGWVSRPISPQHPRRLSEYVRRSLFSAGSEIEGQGSNNSLSRLSATASSQERVPTGAGNHGHHRARLRSSLWVDRQGDTDFGIPYSLRALATGSEGSSRLVSEIRNVLGLMRRGESLRIEDVMILDHSVFSGVVDFHDRHRDMRLDVDNMSYEELLALEERIGNVCTGLSEEIISNSLKQKKYVLAGESQIEPEPCCICQEEYNDGEDVGTLDCGHDFHSNCIKQWLMHKNLCPICKTAGLAT